MSNTNPARRFLDLFVGIERDKVHGENSGKVWAKILNVDRKSPKFIPLLGRALYLPWEIEQEIKKIPELPHARYLSWVVPMQLAFTKLNLDAPFGEYGIVFDQNVRALIEICEDVLARNRPQAGIPSEELKRIQRLVREAIDATAAEQGINPVLRDYMLHNLNLVENAINDYRVMGIEVITEAVERVFGSAYLRRPTVDELNTTKSGESFKIAIAALIVATITAYPQMKELGRDVRGLLPPGFQNAEQVGAEASPQ